MYYNSLRLIDEFYIESIEEYHTLRIFYSFQGADVNAGEHEHGYSTLHFAALANKIGICQILLENGVKVDRINSVKRTAAQMAAFVGQSNWRNIFNFYAFL